MASAAAAIASKFAFRTIATCCGISAVIAAVLFWMDDPFNVRAPSDHQLMVAFGNHRAAFEDLRRMVSEDNEGYLTASYLGKLPDHRKEIYRALIREIDPGLTLTKDYGGVVRFIYAEGGLSAISAGWLKGIEYLEDVSKRKTKLVQSLNHARNLAPDVYLRPIEGNWYILYQRTDD